MTQQQWYDEADRYEALIQAELEKPALEQRVYMIDAWSAKKNGCYTAAAHAPQGDFDSDCSECGMSDGTHYNYCSNDFKKCFY